MPMCSSHFIRSEKLREPGSPNTTRKDRTTAWEKYRLPCSDGRSKKPETLLLNCVIDGEAYARTGKDSRSGRKEMVDREHELSIKRQCQLLALNRSTVHYQRAAVSEEDLALMRRIDEMHLKLMQRP